MEFYLINSFIGVLFIGYFITTEILNDYNKLKLPIFYLGVDTSANLNIYICVCKTKTVGSNVPNTTYTNYIPVVSMYFFALRREIKVKREILQHFRFNGECEDRYYLKLGYYKYDILFFSYLYKKICLLPSM